MTRPWISDSVAGPVFGDLEKIWDGNGTLASEASLTGTFSCAGNACKLTP
jgi:hypothetical protein